VDLRFDTEEQWRDYCLAALFLTDPYIDRSELTTAKGPRVQGTCQWITTNETYASWLASQSQFLWLSDGPGKGKTMLSIFLTEELEKIVAQSQDASLRTSFATIGTRSVTLLSLCSEDSYSNSFNNIQESGKADELKFRT
jgi:hypothetical protein